MTKVRCGRCLRVLAELLGFSGCLVVRCPRCEIDNVFEGTVA